MPADTFETDFLSATPAGRLAFRHAMGVASDAMAESYASVESCYQGGTAQEIAARVAKIAICPEEGMGLEAAIQQVSDLVMRQSVIVSDPTCLGHLHCPPLLTGIAAELMIGASNQSMDSWDQAPAATYLEQHFIDWLCRLIGLGEDADGIFTSGGTQSNFQAMLLARNLAGQKRNWMIRRQGMTDEARKLRLFCSEAAHFSVQQSAAILGLGESAVVPLPVDQDRRMDADALAAAVAQARSDGLIPFAVFATAGTTDFGSIDPLHALADICAAEDMWLHVDAAYGGALALSDKHAHLLDGIGRADSVTVDFHKLFYQPISCASFLVRRKADFEAILLKADYLNPEENEEDGVLDLVGKSIQTTRRFDGLKPFLTLQAMGRKRFAEMIDGTIDLALETADLIETDAELDLVARPTINALVFRYVGQDANDPRLDHANREIRRLLLAEGKALLANTKVAGRAYLKLTMLNPRTTLDHVRGILGDVKAAGREILAQARTGEMIA